MSSRLGGWVLAWGAVGLMACQLAAPMPTPTAVWPPTPTLAILAPTPEPSPLPTSAPDSIAMPLPPATATPTADTGWELLREGLERRQITLARSERNADHFAPRPRTISLGGGL
ncbi:MAG: hypothetical protein IPL28_22740 [Chloroflexi bacterium]|nr:hypothetical protein [Chloroflexota bacterium]